MKSNTTSTVRKPLRTQLKKLKQVLKGGPINAYSDEGVERKDQLHRVCRYILTALATDLCLPTASYQVSSNMSGIAGCGDIQLVTPFFRVQLDDGYSMRGRFYYRKETASNNCGFTPPMCNRWWSLEDLINDYPAFLAECRKVMFEPNSDLP